MRGHFIGTIVDSVQRVSYILSVLPAVAACLRLFSLSMVMMIIMWRRSNSKPACLQVQPEFSFPSSQFRLLLILVDAPLCTHKTRQDCCISSCTPVKHLFSKPFGPLLLCLTRVLLWCTAFDRETGKAKGFAHIQFDSLESAAKALKLSGQDFGGREIFLDTAQERTGGGGGGAAGGFGGGERPQRSEYSMLTGPG